MVQSGRSKFKISEVSQALSLKRSGVQIQVIGVEKVQALVSDIDSDSF